MISTHYPGLTEKSAIANFIYDVNADKIVYINAAFRKLIELATDSPSIEQIKNLIDPEDRNYAVDCFKLLLKGKLTEQVHIRVNLEENKQIWLRLMCSLEENAEEKLIYGHAIDITASVVNQHTFEKYGNKKNAILNILAHELAGSLSIVRVLSSSLKSENLSEYHNNQVNSISEINTQAINLIRDLTGREFLETTEIVLNKRRVDIAKKIMEYFEEAQYAENNIKRKVHFEASPNSIFLSVDEAKFMQIMNNLLSNALKFTTENGVINVSIEEKEDRVSFKVSDNGIGIPKKDHTILFDQYTSAGRKGLQGEPSMGLGMNVVKSIIEWHDGKIWFESEENVGTTFYFEIPKGLLPSV